MNIDADELTRQTHGEGHSRQWRDGRRNGIKLAVSWLRDQAAKMNDPDPKAREVLYSASFQFGVFAKYHEEVAPPPPSPDATIKALVEATEGFLSAFDKLKVRLLVAGWNGEDKSDGPYERHPNLLGVTLRTNCGQVYALDEAAEGARDALALVRKGV